MNNLEIKKFRNLCRQYFSPHLLEMPEVIKQDSDTIYHLCPCGSISHYATRCADPDGQVGDGYSDVLHCWETRQQWFCGSFQVENNNIKYVSDIIRGEEQKYFDLLNRSPKTIQKFMKKQKITSPNNFTGKHLCVLWHTYGLDIEVVSGCLGIEFPKQIRDEFMEMKNEHKTTGKQNYKS